MAILGSSFQIGRSALAAYQSAIAITGQNIANVGNANYTRQSGHLSALPGGTTLAGVTPGTGVSLDMLQRHLDEAVESRLRLALAERHEAQTRYQALNRVESLYGELTDYDLSTQLSTLFSGFANLQTDPADLSARELVLANAEAVVRTLQHQRSGLLDGVRELNDMTTEITRSANATLVELGQLNQQIMTATARGSGGDSALRDRRDALLRSLSELMDIQTREQSNGVLNVYVGSEPLVEFNRTRGLTTERVLEDGLERVQVRFADNKGTVNLRSGQLAAIAVARDTHLASELDQLDQLAQGLIYEVNRVHSCGQGLRGWTTLTGAYAVDHPGVALNTSAAGLTFPVSNGTFLVQVRDRSSSKTTTRMIEVDLDGIIDPLDATASDTTLTLLAEALDAVPGLTAFVTADNRLRIDADAGYQVSFADDTSGVLAALGLGTFFEGTNAATIAVNADLHDDPRLIATSLTNAAGDGSNAGRLAAVGASASSLLGDLGVQDFHESIVHQLAVNTAAAQTEFDARDAVYASLLAQREAVSGVSLDEEAINLTMFERSFQGASRYVSVLSTLSEELLTLVS